MSKMANMIHRVRTTRRHGRMTAMLLMLLLPLAVVAQITIGGNIYGGGNAGNTGGNTSVTVRCGDLKNVYGGARRADVGGMTFVNIDGEKASSFIVINKVFGGNDISGRIGTSPLVKVLPTEINHEDATGNGVDASWDAIVHISTKTETVAGEEVAAADAEKVYIGQLFGGGNGDYDYTSAKLSDGETDNPYYGLSIPELDKSYIEILGGSINYAYGGGNNATVRSNAVICVDNPSEVVNEIWVKDGEEVDEGIVGAINILNSERFREMGINTGFAFPSSDAFQIGRLFGGNNKADMKIRPTWDLVSGKIRNVYSGGNQGRMTCPEGLLLEIAADSKIVIDNVFGGCRMSDVRPLDNEGNPVETENIPGYNFPSGLSARLLVRGGDINNVYGGNDITGKVYGGNAVGVYTSIRGNVYGGGNGAYPYTDNSNLIGDDVYGDLYYDPSAAATSVKALNAFRPNVEQVSLRLLGTESKKTIIGGSVYVGGNCATLQTTRANALVELKIGSYVIADNVFLGNNGEMMVSKQEGDGSSAATEGILRTMNRTDIPETKDTKFNSINLENAADFAEYMEGAAAFLVPRIVFDSEANGDPATYIPYSSYFGSLFCGGNVGSMIHSGKTTINIDYPIIIYNKLVGGCNTADVSAESSMNAAYDGGILGSSDETIYTLDGTAGGTIKDRLELNLTGLRIRPMRWKMDPENPTEKYINPDTHQPELEWNTVAYNAETDEVEKVSSGTGTGPATVADWHRRFEGGNVYGGCYTSGHVHGNVVININGTIHEPDIVFDEVDSETESGEPTDRLYEIKDNYNITERRSGVAMHTQGMDPLGQALNVFGGGFGAETEIWGSTTINLNDGFTFQIFGGSERGVIGKNSNLVYKTVEGKSVVDTSRSTYDARYSTHVNLCDQTKAGTDTSSDDLAEATFIYGGGFEGPIEGNCYVNLDNGRLFNSFAGSCNADILGHTETYVGKAGFPYVIDHIYGANDLGGTIFSMGGEDTNFKSKVVSGNLSKVYKYNETTNPNPLVLYGSSYVEYQKGHVDYIFGGCYGDYDYLLPAYITRGVAPPFSQSAFVNFRPVMANNPLNGVNRIYGAGQGHLNEEAHLDYKDKMQNRSYVLIDIPSTVVSTEFQNMAVFGTGANCGVGMKKYVSPDASFVDRDSMSAVIDLMQGTIGNSYGGSFAQGFTRRAITNVPSGSTINVNNIFGGSFGNDPNIPCDTYSSQVNYHSEDATVRTNIYGGNNNADRTLYSQVNITAPVWQNRASGYLATVFGAGYGVDTWAQYTEVNLENGAKVYEVYGGGHNGRVINVPSLLKWQQDVYEAEKDKGEDAVFLDLSMGAYTEDGLDNPLVKPSALGGRYNSNVHIKQGAEVVNYAYGGGLGDTSIPGSGDVLGTSYIDLLGGKVQKDIYAAGTTGSVYDELGVTSSGFNSDLDVTGSEKVTPVAVPGFTASATAYIKGGTARNVYGGGWEGSVGRHAGSIEDSYTDDILGETHVIIGDLDGTTFYSGIPAIERNAYGGGEGGAVFGTTNLTLRKGYVGYRFFSTAGDLTPGLTNFADGGGYYEEKLHDETWQGDPTNRLLDSGCLFGGGYIDNSNVDYTNVKMYGGRVRNSLFGGGEIAAIGRGKITATGEKNEIRTLNLIKRAGKTNVELYEGNVYHDVFGGGRGYNNVGEQGTLFSDGYVFGQTHVNIYGGEVGTEAGIADGYGNVFGGGDIGFVYSAYDQDDGSLGIGKKYGKRFDDDKEGYYYKYENDAFVVDVDEYILTEDCKVLVEPHCRVTEAFSVNGHSYAVGDYVPTSDLNYFENKNDDSNWDKINASGIIIHNAVFAGGNTSSGSDKVYANATTVFGNATASIHDVYHRDLITIGQGHIGGLYGDGNLTFVDGYRGLNITNYGTDYYSITKEITLSAYDALPAREKAYYELRYLCIKACTDDENTTYTADNPSSDVKGSTLTADEILTLFKKQEGTVVVGGAPSSEYWTPNGVCSRYAGRPMNTIQRADFCGVFGSRMVMQGAQDRVPELVDYTNYTINRVREVSLNKKLSVIPADASYPEKKMHGNYFGIYNIVNYLGALTSDLDFGDEDADPDPAYDVRTTDNPDSKYTPTGGTFYDWKKLHTDDRTRNNGNSHNQVALASGVYLELTTERSTGPGLYEKDWGYITGVIELDLINVQTGVGGGFVYAKNVHGVRTKDPKKHATLTELNRDAVARRNFTYDQDDADKKDWQTSGNFVHSTQIIIDDCYNVGGKYKGEEIEGGAVPAHYWYIKGEVYVYDQYISAYTGSPNAYSETVDIPLTITAASHGTMKLLKVMPNYYAYYHTSGAKLTPEQKLRIRDVEYELNTPISYWDYYLLAASEKALFVRDTYVTIADCKIDDTSYPSGTVLLPGNEDGSDDGTYYNLKKAVDDGAVVSYLDGETVKTDKNFDYFFRSSNNLRHDTGYILTYNINNPSKWDTWYTPKSGSSLEDKIPVDVYKAKSASEKEAYENGPTYRLIDSTDRLLGQLEYNVSNIISKEIYDTYQDVVRDHSSALPEGQATFEPAYIIVNEVETQDKGDRAHHFYPGAVLAESEYTAAQWAALGSNKAVAYVCTSTIQLTPTEYIYIDSRMSAAERTAYISRFSDGDAETNPEYNPALAAAIEEHVVPAYYCTDDGLYGGNYYESGKNYRGLAAWSSMSAADRDYFTFNYDALDLLIDPSYNTQPDGQKYQYDSAAADLVGAEANKAQYSLQQPVDYTATYHDSDTPLTLDGSVTVKRGGSSISTSTIQYNDELSRDVYESLPNEKRHFSSVKVTDEGTYYVVHTGFQVGNATYAPGSTIEGSVYSGLSSDDKAKVSTLTFTEGQKDQTYYFCRETYKVPTTSITGVDVTGASGGGTTYGVGSDVPIGVIISQAAYNGLVNKQTNFVIHGVAPTESSTLYVSRQSDIFDLSKKKIITVIYQYDYEESDATGNITPVSERHVLNIHIEFKSGIPQVEDIRAPKIVLPGTTVGLREPSVMPGAYEVTGGGWELFQEKSEAESHINGIEFTPNIDPLYWYQKDFYVAYYAKTYLGKTYSNAVQVDVANYHDLTKVMGDKKNHYFVDYDPAKLKRDCKIYITDPVNGASQLKNFFDLSLLTESSPGVTDGVVTTEGPLKDHHVMNSDISKGSNLEFFLHADVNHTGTWTPIGSESEQCFEGNLHGDGYSINGLDHSLFDRLCGNVYNLGVTGSFTEAGIANTGDGYIESSWVMSSATSGFSSKAVFGNPTRGSGYQVVNCYYPETNPYSETPHARGNARKMSARAFYNGEVTFDLNNFYLWKRYNDGMGTSLGTSYTYYKANEDGTLTAPQTGHYSADASLCSSGVGSLKYVESRYSDGDFIYANGSIPEGTDEHQYTDPETGVISYYPIYPDDYYFFGQTLSYGYNPSRPHQDVPSHLNKSGGRLVSDETSNHVHRAPAYYQSKVMGVAHFNPAVNLAAQSKDKTRDAYPNMTAIDFAGHNDNTYKKGFNDGYFFQPLLDDDGIYSVANRDETANLLVYAPARTADAPAYANSKTYDVLTATFVEPAYNDYYIDDNYRRVRAVDAMSIFGHLVKNDKTATNDHLLVDKQDFNAPLSYTFASGKRMWYQRLPESYVDLTKGWETVSLPFSAELVTTNDKGEITHFYSGSATATGSTAKIGHEYWLREYTSAPTPTSDPETYVASFDYPTATGDNKTVTNTFLWDYYYEATTGHNHLDSNKDTYQKYYNSSRDYEDYPLLAHGTPYIIGYPGSRYYEFDLSGTFEAQTTASPNPDKLGQQTITFASAPAATIAVSDDEVTGGEASFANSGTNYIFHPNYMSKPIEGYMMNSLGTSFVATDALTAAVPFRPYFYTTAAGSAKRRAKATPARYILFDSNYSEEALIPIGNTEPDPSNDEVDEGELRFYSRSHTLVAKSTLRHDADVRIFNTSGVIIANFTIHQEETVELPVNTGFYIITADGGKVLKKVAVK